MIARTDGYARRPHWAFVGAKVICVSVEPMCEDMTKALPEVGQIYTLRKVGYCARSRAWSRHAVLLDEIKNPLVGPDYELGFLLSGFKPLQVTK